MLRDLKCCGVLNAKQACLLSYWAKEGGLQGLGARARGELRVLAREGERHRCEAQLEAPPQQSQQESQQLAAATLLLRVGDNGRGRGKG